MRDSFPVDGFLCLHVWQPVDVEQRKKEKDGEKKKKAANLKGRYQGLFILTLTCELLCFSHQTTWIGGVLQ